MIKQIFLMILLLGTITSFASDNRNLNIILNSNSSYLSRAKAITKLSTTLEKKQCDYIFTFLDSSTKGKLSELEINSLKNDLVLVLIKQRNRDNRIVPALISMFKDTKNNVIWRDYCIQFLGRIFEDSSLHDKKAIEEVLKTAINDANSGIVATAFIAISANERSIKESRIILSDKILKLLHGDIPNYAKATILQVGVNLNLNNEGLLNFAKIVLNKTTDVFLKMASIATIGTLGKHNDISLFEKYCHDSDIRLQYTARVAKKKLLKI